MSSKKEKRPKGRKGPGLFDLAISTEDFYAARTKAMLEMKFDTNVSFEFAALAKQENQSKVAGSEKREGQRDMRSSLAAAIMPPASPAPRSFGSRSSDDAQPNISSRVQTANISRAPRGPRRDQYNGNQRERQLQRSEYSPSPLSSMDLNNPSRVMSEQVEKSSMLMTSNRLPSFPPPATYLPSDGYTHHDNDRSQQFTESRPSDDRAERELSAQLDRMSLPPESISDHQNSPSIHSRQSSRSPYPSNANSNYSNMANSRRSKSYHSRSLSTLAEENSGHVLKKARPSPPLPQTTWTAEGPSFRSSKLDSVSNTRNIATKSPFDVFAGRRPGYWQDGSAKEVNSIPAHLFQETLNRSQYEGSTAKRAPGPSVFNRSVSQTLPDALRHASPTVGKSMNSRSSILTAPNNIPLQPYIPDLPRPSVEVPEVDQVNEVALTKAVKPSSSKKRVCDESDETEEVQASTRISGPQPPQQHVAKKTRLIFDEADTSPEVVEGIQELSSDEDPGNTSASPKPEPESNPSTNNPLQITAANPSTPNTQRNVPLFPIEIQNRIIKFGFQPQFVELRFAQNTRSEKYDLVCKYVPRVLQVNNTWKWEALRHCVFLGDMQCNIRVFFNPQVDTLHIQDQHPGRRVLGLDHMLAALRHLPLKDMIRSLSVTNMFFEGPQLTAIPRPLIFQFPNLTRVIISQRLGANWFASSGARVEYYVHMNGCNREFGGDFCFPDGKHVCSDERSFCDHSKPDFQPIVSDLLDGLQKRKWGTMNWKIPRFEFRFLCTVNALDPICPVDGRERVWKKGKAEERLEQIEEDRAAERRQLAREAAERNANPNWLEETRAETRRMERILREAGEHSAADRQEHRDAAEN